MIYAQLIGLGVSFLSQFITSLTANKAPQEVLDAIQASINALTAHQSDVINKANLEAQRG
jgi:hypothetical protein